MNKVYAALLSPEVPDRVQQVASFNSEWHVPEAYVLLQEWSGIPDHPGFEQAELRVRDGVLYWHDPRTLDEVKADQAALIDAAYLDAITSAMSFTTGAGESQVFQADLDSQMTMMKTAIGYNAQGDVPSGFFWRAQDNTNVPFTLADLQGLYSALLQRGQEAFVRRSALKDSIAKATSRDEVLAIVWTSDLPTNP